MKTGLEKWQVKVVFIAAIAVAAAMAIFSTTMSPQTSSGGAKPSAKKFNLANTLLASYSQTTRFTTKLTYMQSGPGRLTGSGIYDFSNNTGLINFTVPVNGQPSHESWIFDGTVMYERMPQLPVKWLRTAVPNGNNFELPSPFAFLDSAPARTILQRFASNGVTEQPSTVAGRKATEYLGTVRLSQLSKLISLPPINEPITIRVWVDSAGVTRQIQTVFSIPSNSSTPNVKPQVSTIQFSDFGIPVSVTPPPSGDVISNLPSSPPPGAPPLPTSGLGKS